MSPSNDRAIGRHKSAAEPKFSSAFGELSETLAEELDALSFPLRYPAGAVLFNEGEPARGVFILLSGRLKLFLRSGEGRTLILRLARAGDVIGLPATLSGHPYELTAETLGPCHLAFIKREAFLRFMNRHQEICVAVTEQLTRIYHSACHEIRNIGLSHSVGEKLANLLLDWPLCKDDTVSRIKFAFRHEEVAQMIGSTRETVSRLFVEFKKRKLATLDGSTLHIRDRERLQLVASGKILIPPKNGHNGNATGKSSSASEQHVDGGNSEHRFYTDGV